MAPQFHVLVHRELAVVCFLAGPYSHLFFSSSFFNFLQFLLLTNQRAVPGYTQKSQSSKESRGSPGNEPKMSTSNKEKSHRFLKDENRYVKRRITH